MSIIHNTIAAACVPLSAVFGSKLGGYVANTAPLPEWASPLLGPIGALAGTLLAIKWLLGRLDKAEKAAENRQQIQDQHLTTLTTLTVQNQAVIEQNSELLHVVKNAIERCAEMKSP